MSVKAVKRYYSLINYLKGFEIEVEIRSNGGRFMSKTQI